jgi:hypothetical protein
VDLAKMSLWLVTLAKDHPLTFVDHALRHGDSLVGLSLAQIQGLNWQPQSVIEGVRAQEHIANVAKLRQQIREADESVSDWERRDLWDKALFELGKVRLFGDLVVAAFFESEKPKEREAKRGEYASAILSGEAERYSGWLEERRHGEQPFVPFHWEIEFPEAFQRENGGFDAIVGNPPFLGGKKITGMLSTPYLLWLKSNTAGAGGQADLVAYFFRRSFCLLRENGAFGLIATNTIAQGDTRTSGLLPIRRNGGQIFAANRRVKWPGSAAVTVSTVHVTRCPSISQFHLDGNEVERITAFLLHIGPDENPIQLASNAGICFKGVMLGGDGFLFEDGNTRASSIAEMRHLLSKSPMNSERIFPFLGGDEILSDPEHRHSRYIIDFFGVPESQFNNWPDLVTILRQKVREERAGTRLAELPWWEHERPRPSLRAARKGIEWAFVHPFTSSFHAFARVPTSTIVSTPHCVFCVESFGFFCVLQSRPHEIWARLFGSTLEDRLRYTPSDCFETFPFPDSWQTLTTLEAIGKAYYEFRAALMVKNEEGLTKTYNRFHDPDERDPDILKLRELHVAIDRAVLDAYGWSDIATHCEFLLDYEIDEEEWGDKKKPYRYRWPDEVQDEVLARLLELNAERAKEELHSGADAAKKGGKKTAAKRAPKESHMENLF